VKISEKIILVSKSGIFAGLDEQTGTFEKGTSRRLMDYMGLETGITAVQGGKRVRLTEARDAVIEDYTKDAKKVADDGEKSKATLVQYFVFSDARTGLTEAAPAKVPNSGFQITYEVTIGGDGVAVMKVQKKPLANNNVNAGEMPQAAQQLISDRLE